MSALTEQLVLKEGDVFFVSQETGDVSGNTGLGLYYHDMRYLSILNFKVNGRMPEVLNFSAISKLHGNIAVRQRVISSRRWHRRDATDDQHPA